jgi:hypothetical protein
MTNNIRARKQDKKEPLINQIPKKEDDGISDSEKWRIIEQSGVLNKIATPSRAKEQDEDQESTTIDYALQAIFLAIPFSLLFATFEITVQVQYHEPWSLRQMGWRMLHVLPGKSKSN